MRKVAFADVRVYRAVVVRVIDGDTVVVNIDLGLKTWAHDEHLRLIDVHAPEMTGTDRYRGQMAKDVLESLLASGHPVTIATVKDRSDKYDRYLAQIWTMSGIDVNAEMRSRAPSGGR